MSERLWGPARRTAAALARAILPPTPGFAAPDEETLARLEHLLREFGREGLPLYAGLFQALELAPMPTHRGRTFSRLTPEEAERFVVAGLEGDLARRGLLRALTSAVKAAYFDAPAVYARLGCPYRFENAAATPAWRRQITDGRDLGEDRFECDVIVVGTGAGGAVVAKELAERGHAVLMLEEGALFTRPDFTGRSLECLRAMYRQRGRLAAVGNTLVFITAGRTVGGSTTINTGTCWRTPDWVLDRWTHRLGLADLTAAKLRPYFEQVERELRVAEVEPKVAGGPARVVARGCAALGLHHRPLRRNAPECDGSSVCNFGCPTDAKLGTNLTYVPAALRRGAALLTGVRAEEILLAGGGAVGVRARALATGRTVTVRARATVLAGGTLLSPLLLAGVRGVAGRAHVGRHLSLHPALGVSGRFDEEIRSYTAIPQGHAVDELHRDGVLIMGASTPIDMAGAVFELVGDKLMEVMADYDRVCTFGVMVEDGPNGRVRPGPGGRPLCTYWLGRAERERLLRGAAMLARIYFAAGAREVYTGIRGHGVLTGPADVARLGAAWPAASDFTLASFHPLGTCRMATSPRTGVVSPEHEVFGVPDLFVVDGSVVPTSVAVNPQVTIMALATRAAAALAARLDGAAA
ncbi:MAG TPA: GMC family oxidoreductase [Polyangia bacterium]|jgi:hypothetical protein